MTSYYNPEFRKYSLDDLRKLKASIKINKKQQSAIFKATLKRANSRIWYEQRAERISGSKFKNACRTKVYKPSLSLIKSIYYPCKIISKIPALKYARKTYYYVKHRANHDWNRKMRFQSALYNKFFLLNITLFFK